MSGGTPVDWEEIRGRTRWLRSLVAKGYTKSNRSFPQKVHVEVGAFQSLASSRGKHCWELLEHDDNDIPFWQSLELNYNVPPRGKIGWLTFSTVKRRTLEPLRRKGCFTPETGELKLNPKIVEVGPTQAHVPYNGVAEPDRSRPQELVKAQEVAAPATGPGVAQMLTETAKAHPVIFTTVAGAFFAKAVDDLTASQDLLNEMSEKLQKLARLEKLEERLRQIGIKIDLDDP